LKKTFNNQAGFENVQVVKGLFKKKGISTQERQAYEEYFQDLEDYKPDY